MEDSTPDCGRWRHRPRLGGEDSNHGGERVEQMRVRLVVGDVTGLSCYTIVVGGDTNHGGVIIFFRNTAG